MLKAVVEERSFLRRFDPECFAYASQSRAISHAKSTLQRLQKRLVLVYAKREAGLTELEKKPVERQVRLCCLHMESLTSAEDIAYDHPNFLIKRWHRGVDLSIEPACHPEGCAAGQQPSQVIHWCLPFSWYYLFLYISPDVMP